MLPEPNFGLFGVLPPGLADIPDGAIQFSPLMPGARAFEQTPPGGLAGLALHAPQGTVERRAVVATALRSLAPGAPFSIMAAKDRGGLRLREELDAFGCAAQERSKSHFRICTGERPAALEGIEAAIAEGAPRLVEAIGLWSQPGVFSWDRIDPGSALLAAHLPRFSGQGADFGAGIGFLALAVLKSDNVRALTLFEIDRRAVELSRRNVADVRAQHMWADVRSCTQQDLDFVVMNPPFHDSGREDKALGQEFIRRAAAALRKGGALWLVANRHLPYEAVLAPLFRKVAPVADGGGYKILCATR